MLEWDWKNIQRSNSIDSNVSVEIFIVFCKWEVETQFPVSSQLRRCLQHEYKELLMLILFVSILFALCVADQPLSVELQFGAFETTFGRKYVDAAERSYRLSVFNTNMNIIEAYNSKQNSFVLGVTPFADLTNDEFRERFASNKMIQEKSKDIKLSMAVGSMNSLSSLPQSVDWRQKRAVSSVKDQASCGSCWAFSAVGSIEGAYAIKTGELVSFSPQQLMDCDYSNHGCSGGLMTYAFEYVMNHGVSLESDYPYQAKEGSCKTVDYVTSILGYYDVPTGSSYELLKAASKNPVAVAIEADSSVFQLYTEGILDDSACGTSLNHGVLLVGYELDTTTPYLIVKNSWGEEWGEEGYIRLAIKDNYAGMCGINLMASYPFIEL